MVRKHIHHIIPKHMGGSDDTDNLCLLTIEEHAEAHRLLWLKHNKKADFIAWQMLSGRTITEEDRIELSKEGFRAFLEDPERKLAWVNKIKTARKHQIITKEHKNAISVGLKRAYAEGRAKHVPLSKEFLKKNYWKTKQKMDKGRKISKKWHEAVRSEATKIKKIASDPRTTPVKINNILYMSINQAKLAGYSRSYILAEIKKQKG